MLAHPQQVFFSKDYARHHGQQSAEACLSAMQARARPGAVLVCAWGEQGASAVDEARAIVHAPAFAPEKYT